MGPNCPDYDAPLSLRIPDQRAPGTRLGFDESPDALERLLPPDGSVRLPGRRGGLEPGSTAELELRFGSLRLLWVARNTECVPVSQFCDGQEQGPCRTWRHARTA